MSLDGLPGLVDSATASVQAGAQSLGNTISNASTSVSNFISQGPASALGAIGDSISGIFQSISSFIKPLAGVKLPMPNPLFSYASYDYVLGIGCLTDEQLKNPSLYMSTSQYLLICKSANADPNNRVNTPYGKFDFFIDNLEVKGVLSGNGGKNSAVTNITFDITEPYSMGLFYIACQQAADQTGHKNWRDAPYLLTIEFRGNTETGAMANIPNTTRKLVFKFQNLTMKVNEKGSVYNVEAFVQGGQAHTTEYASLKTDVSVKGSTVQEVLQTGDKSLQVAVNQRLQKMKQDKIVTVADEIIIMFPKDISSGQTPATDTTAPESTTGATQATDSPTASSVFTKLGLTRSPTNKTLVQSAANCNPLGISSLAFNEKKKGDPSTGQENKQYDPQGKVYVRGKNTIDPTVSEFKFTQDSDIINSINQVMLKSEYAEKALEEKNVTPTGMRQWWTVDTQVYNIGEIEKNTGKKPKLIIYRVIPFEAHTSKIMPPNTKAPGFELLKAQAVKEYNYIYTGKNIDVIKFDIEYNASFSTTLPAGSLANTQGQKLEAAQGGTKEKTVATSVPLADGNAPTGKAGTNPTTNKYSGTNQATDGKGGGGTEDQKTRAARVWHDAINGGTDMLQLNMEIIGDPYFIMQSGAGNYTSPPSQYSNLNADGSMNYQNGEVDIVVNFRTPIDINQTTGLYNFGGTPTAPVMAFSGLYCINNVESHFKQGKFTQNLIGFRRPGQELSKTGTPFNTTATKVDPNNPDGEGPKAPPPISNNGWGEG
jgi:hypothetical protein